MTTKPMRIAVVGLGAVGGYLAARLALAADGAHRVSAVARGATLAEVRAHGLRLHEGGRETAVRRLVPSDDPAALGVQDLVIVAVKGPSLPSLAGSLAPLIGP
ncbi:MAG TPA: 2-dehydropantoate 2-reductase N-terminal domain-containing protein, partial [Burkholderiaceae bacterium]|nr:2-dehydropantoate 2-reductase N-terminal domain-containing protein [Burkholderiaceae bacterium]